jgi:phage shock protein C
MSTRTRRSTQTEEEQSADYLSDDLFLDEVTDDDIEAFLLEREEEKEQGFWNLPTVAGLSIISVGVVYLLQQMGLSLPLDFSALVGALPWLAGVLIILLGFGVLSWKPKKERRKERRKKRARVRTAPPAAASKAKADVRDEPKTTRRRLTKSRTNKKLAGVCGGLGEYFGIDPTLIRIGFVIATVFGGGFPAIPLYIVLAIIMSNADKKQQQQQQQLRSREERIRVVRDS